MSGSVELDRDGRSLLIRFPYNPYVVEEVKAIPGRRWDPARKVWKVPVTSVDAACSTGMRHGFAIAPEVTGLLAGTTGSAAEPAAAAAAPPVPSAALTISTLNARVRDAVLQAFPDPVWVVGEVLDYDKNQARKHVFFALVEKQGERTIAARASVAMFERDAERIRAQLRTSQGELALADGIEIRALVRVDFYAQGGSYQLVLQEIDPTFTLGKMALQREAILAELRQLGLERRNAALPLPLPPLRVGVLCSPDSDGWNDFRKTLETSGIGFDVTLHPVRVQGPELQATMLAGLRWFAEHAAEFDLLCVIRGGGSRTDLAWFDDREVALAVARHPLKVLCGIGHERDQSVLDLIAHSEKTPTALAAFLVEQVAIAERRLVDAARRLAEVTAAAFAEARAGLARLAHRLQLAYGRRLADRRHGLHRSAELLRRATRLLLERRGRELALAGEKIALRAQARLEREQARLREAETRCRLLDPRSVLARGYAILRRGDDRILTGVRAVRPGDALAIQMRDGRLAVRAEAVHQAPPADE